MESEEIYADLGCDFRLRTPKKTFEINFPKGWAGVKMKHRILYTEWLLAFDVSRALTRILLHFLEDKGVPKKLLLDESIFTAEKKQDASAYFKCLIFDDDYKDTSPLFETFGIGHTQYQLLAHRFTNGIVREYRKADELYNRIVKGEDKYLELMACLCRPVVKGVPQPLASDADLAQRVQALRQMGQNIVPYQFAVLRYYMGIRLYVDTKWGSVLFERAKEGETQVETQPANNLGWWNLIYAAAENITKVNEVENQNFHQFCAWWYKKKLDDDAYKQMMENSGLKTD